MRNEPKQGKARKALVLLRSRAPRSSNIAAMPRAIYFVLTFLAGAAVGSWVLWIYLVGFPSSESLPAPTEAAPATLTPQAAPPPQPAAPPSPPADAVAEPT